MNNTILKNIVVFENLVLNTPVSLPHMLNVNGFAVAPKLVGANKAGFTISADITNITVTRTALSDGDTVDIYAEYWHTIESVTPLVPPPGKLGGLTPFILATGAGTDVDTQPQIARGVFRGADGSTINSVGCSCARNNTGQYHVTFNPPFPDTCAPVATIAEDLGTTIFGIYLINISGTGCDVVIRGNTDGFIFEDADFSIVAVESTTAP